MIKKCLSILCCFVIMLSVLSGCNSADPISELTFLFNSDNPADFKDEQLLFINEDFENLVLNATLKVEGSAVKIEVIENATGTILWRGDYIENADFQIELSDLKAENEYKLRLETTLTEKVKLTVTSDVKLVKDKEKPERYKIEK